MSFHWITPQLAVGGHIPPSDIAALASDHEIRAVIDLRAEARDDEAALKAAGVAFLHLPTPDEHPSTLADLDRGVAFARAWLGAGERVLIHCQHGIGRSALQALCVLCDAGEPPLEALRRVKDARDVVSPSAAQFDGWCAWLTARGVGAPDYESFARIAYRPRAGTASA